MPPDFVDVVIHHDQAGMLACQCCIVLLLHNFKLPLEFLRVLECILDLNAEFTIVIQYFAASSHSSSKPLSYPIRCMGFNMLAKMLHSASADQK